MRTQLFIVTVVLFAGVIGSPTSVHAQIKRYRSPSGPTLPSQLNYFRGDVGLLDPYNSIVNPSNQLNNQVRSMEKQQEANRRAIDQTRQELLLPSEAAPTGTGATFGNYSHYYPSIKSSGGGSARRAPSRGR